MEKDREIVACIRVKEMCGEPHSESLLASCPKCESNIWVMPHNKDKELICNQCVKYALLTDEDVTVCVKGIDFKKAKEQIEKEKNDREKEKTQEP